MAGRVFDQHALYHIAGELDVLGRSGGLYPRGYEKSKRNPTVAEYMTHLECELGLTVFAVIGPRDQNDCWYRIITVRDVETGM